jgi:23S rRNA (cytidine2498-2'-O)-methyltransferase
MHWLVVDMNVAPRYTLDTVEAIVTHPEVSIRGLLLTLKLLDWNLADEMPLHLARIRSWGFRDVRARQLTHNRQELCVAAMREFG